MFNDLENYYPSKPKLPSVKFKDVLQKNMIFFSILVFLMVFFYNENILLILSVFGIILFHEFGHFIGMKIFKFNDSKMMYVPFFSPFLKQKTETVSQKQYLITLLLGSLPGLIIGTLLFYAYLNSQNDLLLNISTLFIAINIFSLLPFDPLDGGKLIETLFFPNNNTVKMYFVLLSSIIFIFIGFYFEMYIIMAFGFLMAFKVKSIQKNDGIHQELDEQGIDYKKNYKSLTDREYWKIRSVFLENNPKLKELIPSTDTLWENENLLIDQISQILKIEIKKDASVFFKLLIMIIVGAAIFFPIDLLISHWDSVFKPLIENTNV
jgi:hypothetical protein